jgi:PAS domain S-box-containing protein
MLALQGRAATALPSANYCRCGFVSIGGEGNIILALPATAHRRAAPAAFDETGRFFDLSHDLLATATPDGRFRRVNGAWKERLGYSDAKLRDRPVVEFVHPGDVDTTLAAIAELDAGAKSVDFEIHVRASNGVYHWLRWTADLEGGVVYAVARDISEQRALGESLAKEQAYSRALIESSVDGLVTVDFELMITDVNETMCQMLGRPRGELVGSVFSDHVLENNQAIAGVRRAFAQGAITNYDLTLQASDGRLVPVSFNAGVYRDAAGEVAGVSAAARDMTTHKALQQGLLEAQFYTRSLIESSLDAMMATDTAGVITDVNRQMERLTGSSREELIGSPFRDYVTEPERADDGIKQTLREGSIANLELIARARDGQETVLSYNATTFTDRDGTVQGVFSTARDITEYKARARELEASNRELEAFSYSVSHDLRAPLRAIDGFSSALERRYAGQLDDGAQDMLGRVRAATTKMSTLIDALLVLSRLSRRPLTFRQLDLSALAREIVGELRTRDPDRDVEFVIEDGLSAVGDQALARTVLANLFENAWKFTAQRERARIELASAEERSFVVRDNGAGFDMAYADKLFVPFERLHREDEFAGTGIGLATVQRVVNRNGGQLRGEGIVGEGASFYFEFGGHDIAISGEAP